MRRHVLLPLLLALGLVAPAVAAARQPAAAKVGVPVIGKVRIVDVLKPASGTVPHQGSVLVRVTVRHPALGAPAPGVRSVGTATVIVTRFTGDRNYSIAGGTAARALPIATTPLDVVYQVVLNPAQSAKARSAARSGQLHIVISVDQRANATGRAPTSNGAFAQQDITLGAATINELSALPPLLAKGAARVAIDVNPIGQSIVIGVDVPLGGGRHLHLDTGGIKQNGLVPFGGGDGALTGTATVVDTKGTVLATGTIVPGQILLRVAPTGKQRGVLTIGTLTIGAYAVAPQQILLAPPPTRAPRR